MLPRIHPGLLNPNVLKPWEADALPLGELPFIDRPPGDGGLGTIDYAIACADDWGLDANQFIEMRDAMSDAVYQVAVECWRRWVEVI